MSARWNRRRPTRWTIPYHAQAIELLDSAADHYWTAVRVPQLRWHDIPEAKKLLKLAREARAQVGPVLP